MPVQAQRLVGCLGWRRLPPDLRLGFFLSFFHSYLPGGPKDIEVFAVVWCIAGVVIQGMWVELGVGVGAPHVFGGRVSGGFGGYLVLLRGVCADELSLLREECWVVWQWAGAVKTIASCC